RASHAGDFVVKWDSVEPIMESG
ncbi:MAG: hypothetical protein JWN00_215, partial [Actinomycetia bacterium]|nr:hypothetical protein [Actinomycetes bacterium]